MISQNPEPKLKYSKNRIFLTSHFGTLYVKCTWSFSDSINMHAQNTGIQEFLLGKSSKHFDAEIVTSEESFSIDAEKSFF